MTFVHICICGWMCVLNTRVYFHAKARGKPGYQFSGTIFFWGSEGIGRCLSLTWSSLSRQTGLDRWSASHRDSPAFASSLLGSQAHATRPGISLGFWGLKSGPICNEGLPYSPTVSFKLRNVTYDPLAHEFEFWIWSLVIPPDMFQKHKLSCASFTFLN